MSEPEKKHAVDGKPATLDEWQTAFKEGQYLRRLGQFAGLNVLCRSFPGPLLESDLTPGEHAHILPALLRCDCLMEIQVAGYSGKAYMINPEVLQALDIAADRLRLPRINRPFEEHA